MITKKAKSPSVALPAGLANTAWHMLIMREFTRAQVRSKCYKHWKERLPQISEEEKKRAGAELVTPEVQLSHPSNMQRCIHTLCKVPEVCVCVCVCVCVSA